MNCPQNIDWKAYALGEMNEADKRAASAHAATCSECREELSGLQVTLSALATLREEELPRRIAFVSDPVFEPKWWQRLFTPTFAAACVVAAAIVFHAYAAKGPSETEIQARIDKAVNKEIQDRMVLFEQKDRQFAQAYMAAVNLVRQ